MWSIVILLVAIRVALCICTYKKKTNDIKLKRIKISKILKGKKKTNDIIILKQIAFVKIKVLSQMSLCPFVYLNLKYACLLDTFI